MKKSINIMWVLIIVFLLAGCSKEVARSALNEMTNEIEALDVEDKDILDRVLMIDTPNSTCFSSIGYDDNDEILIVTFKDSGKTYLYYEFPLSEWNIFRKEKSLGGWYNKNIKGSYICEKYENMK